jgi:hypothetical protein
MSTNNSFRVLHDGDLYTGHIISLRQVPLAVVIGKAETR